MSEIAVTVKSRKRTEPISWDKAGLLYILGYVYIPIVQCIDL